MSKECKLRLFTWTCKSDSGQTEVVPVCPVHNKSRVRFGRFATGMIVICDIGTHLVGFCDAAEEFEAESEEARARLISRNRASA